MREHLRLVQSTERLISVAEDIGYQALVEITERYGDGYEQSQLVPSVADLTYHNMQHTLRGYNHLKVLARIVGLSAHDSANAGRAFLAHDFEHTDGHGQSEQTSADWLASKMRAAACAEDDVVTCTLAILGTEPVFTHGKMTGQKVTQLTYPSEEARRIAQVVASADMADLFSPYGPLISRDLYKEYQGVGTKDEPPMDVEKLLDFQREEVRLTVGYRFPMPEAEVAFAGLRHEVIWHHIAVLTRLERGDITTWQQLLAFDQAFADKHASSRATLA